jgi:hypothetical protein
MRAARLAALALVTFGACAHTAPMADVAITPPARLCEDERLTPDDFCLPGERLEALLAHAPFRIVAAGSPGRGVGGAYVLVLDFPDERIRVRAKWKPAGRGGDGFNRSPRHELAAFALQKMFLPPDAWVVPPTVVRCLPLAIQRTKIDEEEATFNGTDCVLGTLSYWIEGVGGLDFDRGRYARDLGYRATIANLNLLTFLIDHRDTRASNFLLSKDRERPRAFSIDNGLAFSGVLNPIQIFVEDWSELRVPLVPSETAEQLWHITRADLDRLLVVAQLDASDGQLELMAPSEPFDVEHGVRRRGNVIQFGLTRKEIDRIASRLQEVLLRLGMGRMAVFDAPAAHDRADRHRRGGHF